MKILFITPYITSACHPAFLRNQTGFGYMVHDIAQYVAKTEEVDICNHGFHSKDGSGWFQSGGQK